jgi:hypothetical protein
MQTGLHFPRRLRFAELSYPRQKLLRLCQTTNFGSILGLEIREGEPVFDPAPVLLFDVKLDRSDPPRSETELPDFDLTQEAVRLMDRLDQMVTTTIELLEVRAGIPRRVVFRAGVALATGFNFLIQEGGKENRS